MIFKSSSGADASWEKLLPSDQIEIHEEYLNLFFLYIYERMEIWVKKNHQKLPFPWTNWDLLRDYKFTNSYRELDRNSQWEIKNIIQQKIDSKQRVWQLIFFRVVNNPEFFEFYTSLFYEGKKMPLMEDFDKVKFWIALKKYRDLKKNPYTSAYLINTLSCPGKKRDYCFVNNIVPTILENIDEIFDIISSNSTPEVLIKKLNTLPSISNFVSHEIFVSLTYFSRYAEALNDWTENDYTNVGPGASLGIRLIFPSTSSKDQKSRIYDLLEFAPDFLNNDFKFLYYDKEKQNYVLRKGVENFNLTLHNIEFCLCEFGKLWKMINNVGKQRSLYQLKYE